ncbi:hypothetical protein Cgig2_020838 [Carnegiea gigantea]|uniref:Uncharacterized protein n=1 Tax=Carnegiea gigantea TaxID=171969 RepID=A0A9Q1KIQ0_9CARY|nr:hypothetical protein Cgig2_020838 [Carnegiea gigantea]
MKGLLKGLRYISHIFDSSAKRGVRDSPGRDVPNLPKASRRQPSTESLGSVDSPIGSPSKSSKASRRRSKHKESSSPKATESSTSQDIPNIPKKSRRKKSKDGEDSTRSTKSKDKGSRRGSRHGSDDGSVKQFASDGYSSSGLTTLREEDHG